METTTYIKIIDNFHGEFKGWKKAEPLQQLNRLLCNPHHVSLSYSCENYSQFIMM